jgi:hypothetical protein
MYTLQSFHDKVELKRLPEPIGDRCHPTVVLTELVVGNTRIERHNNLNFLLFDGYTSP